MIGRLGIVGRLLIIGALGFSAFLIVLGVLLYQLRTQEGELERRFPLPAQIAAIVDVIDQTPAVARQSLLAALNTPGLSVTVDPGQPVPSEGSRELPRIENFLTRFDPALATREVVVDIPDDTGHRRPLLDAWTGSVPLRVQIGLADGAHLSIEARGELVRRILGVPSGFWLAATGVLIAGITLIALFRAAQPLRRLTAALETFSETATPVPIRPAGAPDMQRLIGTFNQMQERLSALVKGRTILAGAISHDLRTYLTRLRLRIDTIPDAGEREGAENDIDAMTSIVENALAFAQSASTSGTRETLDLAAIVRAEIVRYASAGSLVTWTDLRQPIPVRGDTMALRRVLSNLVENALRYAGQAEVSLLAADGFADLMVDDRGGGIPPAEREAIFEPFYRLDMSRNTATEGTGLGLALTRQIVEAHGGRITACDAPGGGTRMRVLLPLAA